MPNPVNSAGQMLAQLLTEFGGPEKMVLTRVAIPEPQPGEVLVRIHAASINPVDLKIRQGLPIGPALPAILGADLAGVVVQVGDDVTDFSVGDKVFGCAGGVKGMGGTLAQYIAADAKLLAPKPKTLSFKAAAALPLVSITAFQAIERLQLTADDLVLVHGGTGGVGHIALQLAKAAGAQVVASVGSDEAATIARSLGADATVNYRTDYVASYVERLTDGKGFDAIIDTVGGDNLALSFEAAAYGGKIATTNARTVADLGLMHGKALSLDVVFMLLPMLRGIARNEHGLILRDIGMLAECGKLKPLIDPVHFRLENAGNAHAHLASGQARGKVVVTVG